MLTLHSCSNIIQFVKSTICNFVEISWENDERLAGPNQGKLFEKNQIKRPPNWEHLGVYILASLYYILQSQRKCNVTFLGY